MLQTWQLQSNSTCLNSSHDAATPLRSTTDPTGSATVAVLLNTHGYYQQFLPAVASAIKKLADPVEKEFKVNDEAVSTGSSNNYSYPHNVAFLSFIFERERERERESHSRLGNQTYHDCVLCSQEYLRIMRWNDGNYWAIRQATMRSHRTLVKYMNKYKVRHQSWNT